MPQTWGAADMSVYDRYVLPRLIDFSMRNREVRRYRARLMPMAHGTVVEIGVGSGLNLPHYGTGVERLIGVDPSHELLAMARQKHPRTAFPVELLPAAAEALPLEDGRVDTAVTTFTLCSVVDPHIALRELRRVLRPGGTLLFAEHGLAPEARVERWQHRLNPMWRRFAGGCNLDRPMAALIRGAGFEIAELDTSYLKGPKPLTYVSAGRALRS